MIRLEEALRIINSCKVELMDAEQIALNQSLKRVLAEDILSDMDFPSFNKSAMDGFAMKKSDMGKKLKITDFIPAGKKPERTVEPGCCAKIMTGAMVPEGADMVIMKENVIVEDDTITILRSSSKTNILCKGEDAKSGDLMLQKGQKINAVHIGMMASVGMLQPVVFKKPVISILSTGDELVSPEEKPIPPQIRNSNSAQLQALAMHMGAKVKNLGQVEDRYDLIYQAVKKALDKSNIVVVTGGASVGDFDFTGEVFENLNTRIRFNRLAIQPGKPVLFATMGNKFLFGLSGNPVSSYVQFQLLVKPLFKRLTGIDEDSRMLRLPLASEMNRKRSDRMLFFPVRLNANLEVEPLEYHGSAHLNAYSIADGIGSFPIGLNTLNKGALIDVRPI